MVGPRAAHGGQRPIAEPGWFGSLPILNPAQIADENPDTASRGWSTSRFSRLRVASHAESPSKRGTSASRTGVRSTTNPGVRSWGGSATAVVHSVRFCPYMVMYSAVNFGECDSPNHCGPCSAQTYVKLRHCTETRRREKSCVRDSGSRGRLGIGSTGRPGTWHGYEMIARARL
jgi:hypothetical protein